MALQTPPRPSEAEPLDERPRPRRKGWLAWVALGVGIVVLIGLAVILLPSDTGKDEDKQTARGVAATQFERDKQAVIDAWLSFSRTILEANDPPNPSHPGLAAYSTDRSYEAAVAAIERNRARGVALREPPNSVSRNNPSVISIDSTTAVLQDCDVDGSVLVNMATGEPTPNQGPVPVTSLYRVVLVRASESAPWKVSLSTREQKWDGIAGCAA